MRPTVWVTAERAFTEVFSLTLFAVQAPILGPSAFGLVTAAMVFVNFWEGVPAIAITEALLSVRNLDQQHFRTATTASVLFCLAFGATIFAFAEPLATAFGNAELASIMRVMAVLPLIQCFSIAPVAAAQRAMQFETITLRTTISLIAGGIVGLVLALTGAGVWSLVWQAVAQRLVANVVLWLAVPMPFGLAISRRHFREMAAFASPVMLSRVMGWASSQLPRLFIGGYLGPADLGLFTIATRLNAIVNQVAIEPKARVARVDLRRFAADPRALPAAVRLIFLQMSLLTFPVCAAGAALVPILFHAWLDARWSAAVVPAQLMLLSSAPFVTFYGTTAVLYALNQQKWEAGIATILSVSLVVALAISARFGLVATTAAIAVVPLALTPLPILVTRQKCGLSFADILLPQAVALVAAGLMGGTVLMLRLWLEQRYTSLTTLLVAGAAGAALYGLMVMVFMPRKTLRFAASLRAGR